MAEKLFHLFTAALSLFMLGAAVFNEHFSAAAIFWVGGGLVAILAWSASWLTIDMMNQSEPVRRPSNPRA